MHRKKGGATAGAGGGAGVAASPNSQKVPLPAGLLLPGEVPKLQGGFFG